MKPHYGTVDKVAFMKKIILFVLTKDKAIAWFAKAICVYTGDISVHVTHTFSLFIRAHFSFSIQQELIPVKVRQNRLLRQ